jgi:hypothetical protein
VTATATAKDEPAGQTTSDLPAFIHIRRVNQDGLERTTEVATGGRQVEIVSEHDTAPALIFSWEQ